MGLFSSGGGYGQHNPEFRGQMENYMLQQQMRQAFADDPEGAMTFFQTPMGQSTLNKLGITAEQIAGIGGPAGMPGVEEYGALAPQAQDTYAQAESILGGLGGDVSYDPAGYEGFEFSAPEVAQIAPEIYGQAQTMQEEAAQRGFGSALAQLGKQMGARGLGLGGVGQAAGTSLGRDYMQQVSDIGRQMSMAQAQQQQELAKFDAIRDAERQARQADERRFGAQFGEGQKRFGSELQRYNKLFQAQRAGGLAGLAGQRAGTMGNILGQQSQRAGLPYTMGQQYFGQTANMTGPQARPGIFGRITSGLGSLAKVAAPIVGAAVGGPAGAALGAGLGGAGGR